MAKVKDVYFPGKYASCSTPRLLNIFEKIHTRTARPCLLFTLTIAGAQVTCTSSPYKKAKEWKWKCTASKRTRTFQKSWYYSLACAVFPWVWYSPLHRRLILSMGGRGGWRVYIQVTLCTTEGFGALSLWGSAGRTHLFWWQNRLKAFLVTTGFLFLFPFKAT